MSNPFRLHRTDSESHPTRYYSDRQEKSVAKMIDGKQTKNSGATMWQKGDVTSDKFLFECKTQMKDKKSFTLKEEWFEKNKQESLFMNKEFSAVVFNFGPDKDNYYILDEATFVLMLDALNQVEETME